jgi:integrase
MLLPLRLPALAAIHLCRGGLELISLTVSGGIRVHVAPAKGKEPGELLLGHHWRDWPREWVQRICREARVPVVTAHGMRGLHSTLAVDAGVTSHAVASALGHESFSTTAQSYATPGTLTSARQKRVLRVLAGGRS